jgi:hypothetical protein
MKLMYWVLAFVAASVPLLAPDHTLQQHFALTKPLAMNDRACTRGKRTDILDEPRAAYQGARVLRRVEFGAGNLNKVPQVFVETSDHQPPAPVHSAG